MQSVVTGQAPITLEWKITSGEKQIKTEGKCVDIAAASTPNSRSSSRVPYVHCRIHGASVPQNVSPDDAYCYCCCEAMHAIVVRQ